ncbi:hypothetical protein NKH18_07485 [Streptomyces sp. M10(2022)]
MGQRRAWQQLLRHREVETPSEADAAAVDSSPEPLAHETALHELQEFRVDLRSCLTRWGDALFEIADAVLCGEGPYAIWPS